MSFCDHCEGQRFDRAQVLRVLRAARRKLRHDTRMCRPDDVLRDAIEAVRAIGIPHLDHIDDLLDDDVVH